MGKLGELGKLGKLGELGKLGKLGELGKLGDKISITHYPIAYSLLPIAYSLARSAILSSLHRTTASATNAEVAEKWHNIGLSISKSLKRNGLR